MADFHQYLRAAHGFKKAKGRGRRAKDEATYSHDIRMLISEANQKYVQMDLSAAQTIVEQIIRMDGGIYPAWKMLGEIHKEKGDEKKCFMSWFTAAHCKPKDFHLWLECARMSIDQEGPNETAIYCYNRALRTNPDDISIMYDKAVLYKQMGRLDKAADGFAQLVKALPNDMSVLKEIAQIYTQLHKIPDAITFYENSIQHYKRIGLGSQGGFGWSDLNILVELYMLEKNWHKAIFETKSIGRWLWGRADEIFWDQIQGDDKEWDEFDDSRKVVVREYVPGKYLDSSYVMPIELRVKLGVCRLKLKHVEEALKHFKYLDRQDPSVYYDLFQEAGDALLEYKSHELALEYYGVVAALESAEDPKLWFNMAKCYKEIGNIDDAEECYHAILSLYPNDVDARMKLAEIYEVSDRREEALDLVNEIIALRKQQDIAEKERLAGGQTKEVISAPTFFAAPPSRVPTKERRAQATAAQRAEMKARKTEQTITKYRKLEYLRPRMEMGDADAVRDWLDTAGDLVDQFRNTKAFYPSERSMKFKGFATLAHRRAAKRGTDAIMQRMQHRLQEAMSFEDEELPDTEDLTQFHGLDFDSWLQVFMQYAICLTKHEDVHDAYDVFSAAKEANVFFHHDRRRFIIHVTHLACAVWVKDPDIVSDVSRFFMHNWQFQGDAYSLFVVALIATRQGEEMFHHSANQKYFLRQIKAMDKAITGKNIVGAASLTAKGEDGGTFVPKNFDFTLLMVYGHMLAAGRSYIPALNYYSRAYSLDPDHPLLKLSIAIAYLHRSMQRQSDNRHWEILQSMAFLFDYHNAKEETTKAFGHWDQLQEAEYNVGRAFHQLGLSHLAIPYYERALKISDEHLSAIPDAWDVKYEAAYNLQQIYATSGNPLLAREVTSKYLVL
ncbi:TPR-like protein [Terfezia boudieri ATCC MYA-4762]|uniref:TPR-like protein n=1 Tax=Terfezia boudieri ATCC MYA-4762 TaxID=1051890 RepID=A0A3N4LJV9_9PEZI|nr:TPR-like protein [Terfezia boudieri ATCC MYA-4762]